jgi:hypothetical protein
MANLPNEPGAWDADFSYGYLRRLYAALTERFAPTRLADAGDVSTAPRVFVRHDVDVSVVRALPLAQLERESGIPATYHVMLDSPFYDVRASRDLLTEIRSLGHEVGLHYDVARRKMRDVDAETREADIARACAELEDILGAPVRSLSFHLPVPELIRGPLRVVDRVSGYAMALSTWYLSDSRARWREGEPIAALDRPRAGDLQMLIHPIWWGPDHVHPAARTRAFLLEIAVQTGKSYDELRTLLWDHIIYRAADLD